MEGEEFLAMLPGSCLDDTCINAGMDLLQDRAWSRTWLLNSHFYSLLTSGSRDEYNYASVQSWSQPRALRRTGLTGVTTVFDMDTLVFPVFLPEGHWVRDLHRSGCALTRASRDHALELTPRERCANA